MVGRGLYYQFKAQELLGESHLRSLHREWGRESRGVHPSSPGPGRSIPGNSSSSSPIGARVERMMGHYTRALLLWRELHREHGYYGSQYVMADPLKEGYEVCVGVFVCMYMYVSLCYSCTIMSVSCCAPVSRPGTPTLPTPRTLL